MSEESQSRLDEKLGRRTSKTEKEKPQEEEKSPNQPRVKLNPKISPKGLCVEDCQVMIDKNGKKAPCGKTCVAEKEHDQRHCKRRLHYLVRYLDKERLKRDLKGKNKEPVQLHPRDDSKKELTAIDTSDEDKKEPRDSKKRTTSQEDQTKSSR